MRLGDCLYELRTNILRDKSSQVSGPTDQLWSDETLVRYISEAQDQLARKSECLRDATTPECCRIQTVVGQEFYPMHPKVIGVLSARCVGDAADLGRAGHSNLDTYKSPANSFYWNTQFLVNRAPGKTLAFTTDEGFTADSRNSLNAGTFRVYPNVGATFATLIGIRVVRRPLQQLELSNPTMELEVPEMYHMGLLDYAGYLALRQPDLDVAGGDAPGRAKALLDTFNTMIDDVKRELRRRMYTPLTWNFGQNGFTYESDYYGG